MEDKKRTSFKSFFLAVSLLLVSGISLSNCSRDESEPDDYYVKYEVTSSTLYSGTTLNVKVNDVNSQQTNFVIKTKTPWETTVGPVSKGFVANIAVSEIGTNYGRLTMQTKISVSKNNGPFAVKSNDDSTTPRTYVQSSYGIDF